MFKLFRHLLERNEKKQSPSLRPQHVASCFHHGINKMCLAHFGSDQHTCCKSLNMSVCWEIPHVVFKMSRVGFTFTVNSILAKLKLDVHLNHCKATDVWTCLRQKTNQTECEFVGTLTPKVVLCCDLHKWQSNCSLFQEGNPHVSSEWIIAVIIL